METIQKTDNIDFGSMFEDYFKNKPVSWDDPFVNIKFEKNIKFDFSINPDKFIQWLKTTGEDVVGDYKMDVSSMCEYACLYVAKILKNKKLKGKLFIYCGSFGFWEHYWIGYIFNNQEYFIDLTLKQFISYAPKLAISKASKNKNGYSYKDTYKEDLYEHFKHQI